MKLERLISATPELTLTGQAGNGRDALREITNLRPDVVFLDIKMPHLSGLEVAAQLPGDYSAHLVFATAFDQFAVRAFELNAMDYLLKPYDESRFHDTVGRIFQAERAEMAKVHDFLAKLDAQSQESKLLFKTKEGIRALYSWEILWAESTGNYIKVCTENDAFIARQTLTDFQARLDAARFVRIHRSHVVNVSAVVQFSHLQKGDYDIVLRDNTKLRLSRNYREQFFQLVGEDLAT